MSGWQNDMIEAPKDAMSERAVSRKNAMANSTAPMQDIR
jgi:hypothetical protein